MVNEPPASGMVTEGTGRRRMLVAEALNQVPAVIVKVTTFVG